MPEEKDETDGTPEWAKRLFKNLEQLRGYAGLLMFFLGLPIYGGYQLWNVVSNHRIATSHSAPSPWLTFEDGPARFSLFTTLWLLATFAPLIVLLFARKKPIVMERLKDILKIPR